MPTKQKLQPRSPAIEGFAPQCRQVSAEKYREMVSTLQLSAKAMMPLIEDLLDITKIENDHLELEHRPFDLRNLVEDFLSIAHVRAQEKGLELRLEYDVAQKWFLGDLLRLHQIVMNLLGNAIKFTEKGSVLLKVAEFPAESEEQRNICFEVHDTGLGINEEYFSLIFNKFSQGNTSIRRKFGGVGLGLAIAKRLAVLMKGDITLTSVAGQGSLFKVLIPLDCATVDKVSFYNNPGICGKVRPMNADTDAKPYVLLVEDYQPNILIATTILEELGCEFDVAKNGHEALNLTQDKRYDLILMDIQMPLMDGYETVKQIRAREQEQNLARTYIIGVSAHAFTQDRIRSLNAGMDSYISKPFNIDDLKTKILSSLHPIKAEAV